MKTRMVPGIWPTMALASLTSLLVSGCIPVGAAMSYLGIMVAEGGPKTYRERHPVYVSAQHPRPQGAALSFTPPAPVSPSAEEYLQRGLEAYRSFNLNAALELFTKGLATASGSTRGTLLLYRGDAFFQKGETKAAKEDLRAALQAGVKPDHQCFRADYLALGQEENGG